MFDFCYDADQQITIQEVNERLDRLEDMLKRLQASPTIQRMDDLTQRADDLLEVYSRIGKLTSLEHNLSYLCDKTEGK